MMIAVSARSADPEGIMEERFGRAAGFMLHDTETGAFEFLDNSSGAVLPQGAGIQAAQVLADRGVRAVISGSVGPKAYAALQAAGIEILACSGCSVSEAAARYRDGELGAATVGPADAGKAAAGVPYAGQGMGQGQGQGQGQGMGRGMGPGGPGCRRTGGAGMGLGRGGGRGMGGGGRGMGGGGRGMGGRGMGGGGMGRY